MLRRLVSDEQKEEMWKLFKRGKGLSVRELADEYGVSYAVAYNHTGVREKLEEMGFKSLYEYQGYLAQKRGTTYSEYKKDGAKKRRRRSRNLEFSRLVRTILDETGENQSWLARILDVTRQTVYLYANGSSVPKDKDIIRRLKKVCSRAGVNYQTLDDVLSPKKAEF